MSTRASAREDRIADLHRQAESRVRASGQRYTSQRRRLVEILSRAATPLTIPEILHGRRGFAQSSVYRNLADLEQAGVVRRVRTDEEHARFELTEAFTGHHHHVVCASCGRVEDVDLPANLERSLDRELDRLAGEAGFASIGHRLDLLGLCRDCA